jgi:peptide/nickel transport system permease protein
MVRRAAIRLPLVAVLVLVAFVGTFLLTGLAPGDPAHEALLRGSDAYAAERARLQLDVPLGTRLLTRIGRLLRLDLGSSMRFGRPVLPLVMERATSTALAGGAALVLALAIGVPAGMASARARHRVVRRGVAAVSLVLLSVPALVLAIALSVAFASLRLPPVFVVVLSLALPAAAVIERLQSRAYASASAALCLTAARARGIPADQIAWRHAWPLSLPAVIGVVALLASQILSGSLAVEFVTGWPGLGRLTYDALMARDLDLAAGCVGAAAGLAGLATWASDVVQHALDPRLEDGA